MATLWPKGLRLKKPVQASVASAMEPVHQSRRLMRRDGQAWTFQSCTSGPRLLLSRPSVGSKNTIWASFFFIGNPSTVTGRSQGAARGSPVKGMRHLSSRQMQGSACKEERDKGTQPPHTPGGIAGGRAGGKVGGQTDGDRAGDARVGHVRPVRHGRSEAAMCPRSPVAPT